MSWIIHVGMLWAILYLTNNGKRYLKVSLKF